MSVNILAIILTFSDLQSKQNTGKLVNLTCPASACEVRRNAELKTQKGISGIVLTGVEMSI